MLSKEVTKRFKRFQGERSKKIKKVDLIYSPSGKGILGLSRALDMLVSEEDIHNYLLNEKLCQKSKK